MISFSQIARERKCEYFINLKEWSEPSGAQVYVIGFTNRKDADLKQEFGDQYEYNTQFGQTRDYSSVSEVDAFVRRANHGVTK
jgi:hypothetical protein